MGTRVRSCEGMLGSSRSLCTDIRTDHIYFRRKIVSKLKYQHTQRQQRHNGPTLSAVSLMKRTIFSPICEDCKDAPVAVTWPARILSIHLENT